MKEQIEFAQPIKGVSAFALVEGLEVTTVTEDGTIIGQDNGLPFPAERERYMRTMCSSRLKDKYPERVYAVNLEEIKGTKVVMVRRTA